jgi:hypothetical protein
VGDICLPPELVYIWGALTAGLLVGGIVVGIKLRRTLQQVQRLLEVHEMHE